MKPGTIFEHKYWMDLKNMPLLCVVTATRNRDVYWKAWEAGEPVGHSYCFPMGYANRYVKQVLEEPK
jgi:hypothetical protein